jgi:NAD(P)-dependent dehydrogenase (short-subunit alcohol dehydrogenase family)
VDAINEVQQVYGHIDVLVNNASSMQVGPLEHMTLDDFEKAMGVHFWGAYYTSMAVIPIMKSQGGGRIVNVTSVGARMAVPHLAPYTASKFATAGLSDALRAELTKDNILVSTLYPGLMRTGSPLRASFKGDYEKEFAWFAILDSIPLLTISADHAAAAAVDAARFGTAARTLGLPAKAGALVEELVPGLFAAITAQIGRLMPGPTGSTGDQPRLGLESQSGWSRTFTGLTQAAAVRNNQVPGKEQTET